MTAEHLETPPRVRVLQVGISPITPEAALQRIANWIDDDRREYVCVNTVHSLLCARDDAAVAKVYEKAGMVTPDGMPLVWLSRWRSGRPVERVYGPDLMLACCDRLRDRRVRHYFLGGAEGVPDLLEQKLGDAYPGLVVAGGFSPPFRELSEAEDAELVTRINHASPDIVWVGLGAPKQDLWMARHRASLNAAVLIGVGAAFDFHSGRKKQAPGWMQRNGFEWLFRLASEPRRLAGRYVAGNARFLGLLLAEELRRSR